MQASLNIFRGRLDHCGAN